MPGSPSQGIFLCYRREDAAPYARLLQHELRERFPAAQVFMDVDSIEAGLPFAEVIRAALDSCAVLVALIGRQWATIADEQGSRRLDNPGDYVRFEVQTALERGLRVIPVLVDGARPLREHELPAGLRQLAGLNALELSYGRYEYDAGRLLDLIDRVLAPVRDQEEAVRKPRRLARWTGEARDEAVAAGKCRGWIDSPSDGDTVYTRFEVRGRAHNVPRRHHLWLAHRVGPGGLLWPKDAVSRATVDAVADDVDARHEAGQPVLVGTTSALKSEELSSALKRRGIVHEVLNAKNREREAAIMANAGRKHAVTVTTDMASRGTGIMLGGRPEFLADLELHQRGLSPVETPGDYERAWPEAVEYAKRAAAVEHEEVVALGGLYVLDTDPRGEIMLDQNGHFDVWVYEAGSSPRFYVALVLVTAKLSSDFDKWIAEGSRTGHYPGLRPPPDSYAELATVSLRHKRS